VAVQKPQCTHLRRMASASMPSGVPANSGASLVCIDASGVESGLSSEARKAGALEAAGVEDVGRIERLLAAACGCASNAGASSVAKAPPSPHAGGDAERAGRRRARPRCAPRVRRGAAPPSAGAAPFDQRARPEASGSTGVVAGSASRHSALFSRSAAVRASMKNSSRWSRRPSQNALPGRAGSARRPGA
jgi:hypothetical protein